MLWIWIGFIVLILLVLALDLGVFHKQAHVVSVKEALFWSAIWIGFGLGFGVFIYFAYQNHWMGIGLSQDPVDGRINNGSTAVVKYLTGYIVEKSLSIDNIFVIALIFSYFRVPAMYQHRVLFWGILGALVMRGGMIAAGEQLISRWNWILYVFGVFLLLMAGKMLFMKEHSGDPGSNPVLRWVRRFFPVTDDFHGEHFVVRSGSGEGDALGSDSPLEKAGGHRRGNLMLTPLALSLVVVETTDLIFAVDSIPAIFAITADPFLVFTSNVFAILGLRSLYFALAGMIEKFRYLKVSLAIVLGIVGGKLLAGHWLKENLGGHTNFYLLALVLLVLMSGVGLSLLANRRDARKRELAGIVKPSSAS